MILDIPDELTGYQRQMEIRRQQLKHALAVCKTQKAAAIFLGITERTIRDWLALFPELKPIMKPNEFERIKEFLPPTFEQCEKTTYYRTAKERMKQLIRQYYLMCLTFIIM